MLSTPLYFCLSLGASMLLLGLFLLLLCVSVRRSKSTTAGGQSKVKIKLVSAEPKLNAKISNECCVSPTNCHVGNSFGGPNSNFNLEAYHRIKKMLEEKKDLRTIAQQERLSLGEVRLIASLSE